MTGWEYTTGRWYELEALGQAGWEAYAVVESAESGETVVWMKRQIRTDEQRAATSLVNELTARLRADRVDQRKR